MPEIPDIRIPEIREFRSPPTVPSAPAVTLELGPPIIEMPGCVPVHADAKRNPNLLNADPNGTGAFCPEGEIPAFNPMDFTPSELADSMRRHYPTLTMAYAPDFRQAIAESWPQRMDDAQARADWGWAPRYDLMAMVDDMVAHI